jgi:multidrug efflux pump subunit AcrA (membrane-fusion protein)
MNVLPLLAVLALSDPATATAQPRATPTQAVMTNCQVFIIDDVEVPALENGPLVALNVKEGDLVHRDEVLAQIDDRQAQLQKQSAEAERDAAQAKGADDIDVRYAIKSYELADAELNQDLKIKQNSPGAISDAEIRRKQLVKTREQLGIDRAKLEQKIAQLTARVKSTAVEAADEIILRRKILAPFDGIVVDVSRHSAEWVNAGEAVVRIANMNRLRIEGFLKADEFNPTDVAKRPVTVEIELAQGRREQFTGEVVWVNQLMQAGNKFRIRAEVANRMERDEPLLRPGMTARMIVHLK